MPMYSINKEYLLETTITQLFEQQVDKTSDNIAVSFEGQTLSYLELDQRANQLARYLHENELGAGDYVVVLMQRSLEMIIALYGILKAGAAYVPLDPECPVERLKGIIEDTQAKLIISQPDLLDKLPDNNATLICFEDDKTQSTPDPLLCSYSKSRPAQKANHDDTAYVIFTSSSTGKPKGVMNSHAGIINRLMWMQETFCLNTEDRILQKTPYSFDVSVWEFFWPLLNGAQLVVARPGGHKEPDYLSKILQQAGITIVHFVPSMLRVFLEIGDISRAEALKHVVCSGEVLHYNLQQQFFKQSAAELHNLYGPTEAAIDVSHWHCRRNDARQIGVVK
jgi:amino acid adenylation domain-containing protein